MVSENFLDYKRGENPDWPSSTTVKELETKVLLRTAREGSSSLTVKEVETKVLCGAARGGLSSRTVEVVDPSVAEDNQGGLSTKAVKDVDMWSYCRRQPEKN